MSTHATAHDPRPTPPPEWTPPPGTPGVPPPPPPRPVLPVFYEPLDEPAADDVLGQLLARRVVMVTGPLDARAADDVSGRLLLLDRRSPEPITLHVSCPDAELDAAMGVLATIDLIGAPVHATAAGSVGGAAVAVFAAADERQAHPHATFLLYEPKAELSGDAEQLAVAAEHHRHQLDTLVERIAGASGREADDVAADLRSGKLLTARDALDYGLVQRLTS